MKLLYSYIGTLHPYILTKDIPKYIAPYRQPLTIQYPEVAEGAVIHNIYQICRHVALGMYDRAFLSRLSFMLFIQNRQFAFNADYNFAHGEKGGTN